MVFEDDLVQAIEGGLEVRGIEDGADVLSDFFSQVNLWDVSHGVLLEVKLATLPRDTWEASGERGSQAGMIVTDNEPNTMEAALLEICQEITPVDLGFTDLGTDTEYGSSAGGINSHGDENGAGLNETTDADLFIASVQDKYWKGVQWSGSPFLEFFIELSGGATDLGRSDLQSAKFLEDRGYFAGGNALDVHFRNGQFESSFAADSFFKS
jgi:hypothetical protein